MCIQCSRCVVAGQPGGFAIVGIVAARIVLLLAGVNDRNAVGKNGVGDDVFGQRVVGRVRRKAWYVMVLGEATQKCSVFASIFHGVEFVDEVRDAAGRGFEGCGEWVVAE